MGRSTGSARSLRPQASSAPSSTRSAAAHRIAPATEGWNRQLYFPDTRVLITRFLGEPGVAEVIDFMPVAQPGQGESRLVRTVLNVRGQVPMRVEVEPAFDYGRRGHKADRAEHGLLFRSQRQSLALSSHVPLEVRNGGAYGEFTLGPDERSTFVLDATHGDEPPRSVLRRGNAGVLPKTRWCTGGAGCAGAATWAAGGRRSIARRSRSSSSRTSRPAQS